MEVNWEEEKCKLVAAREAILEEFGKQENSVEKGILNAVWRIVNTLRENVEGGKNEVKVDICFTIKSPYIAVDGVKEEGKIAIPGKKVLEHLEEIGFGSIIISESEHYISFIVLPK